MKISSYLISLTIFAGGILSGILISDYQNNTPERNNESKIDTILGETEDTPLQTPLSEKKYTPPKELFSHIPTDKLEKVYRLLENNFVSPEEITPEKLEEWLIRGVLYSVEDPYTDYFNEEQSDEFKDEMKGDFEGIGAVLEKRKKILYITEVLKNRPAANAGLLPGDIIISVDEKDVSDETIWETVLRIRGEKETDVKIEVVRKGEKKEFSITRQNIHVENATIRWTGKNNDIAILEINQFGDDLKKEFLDIFTQMKQKKYSGIILDLRYNGGGYMNGAVDLASYFLPDDTTVLMVETKKGIEDILKTKITKSSDISTPVIILVNAGTASSSEIFTAALSEHNRATVVGEKTFGKGVVQQLFPLGLDSDEFVKITIAKWLTPNKINVTNEEPLTPDIIVEWDRSEMTDEQFKNNFDPQLEKAIEELEK